MHAREKRVRAGGENRVRGGSEEREVSKNERERGNK